MIIQCISDIKAERVSSSDIFKITKKMVGIHGDNIIVPSSKYLRSFLKLVGELTKKGFEVFYYNVPMNSNDNYRAIMIKTNDILQVN